MLPVLSDADRHAFCLPHLVTVYGKRILSLSFLLFVNEVINKAGFSQVLQNGATVTGVNASHQSWQPRQQINDFVCLFGQ